jgi:hypothetical protein
MTPVELAGIAAEKITKATQTIIAIGTVVATFILFYALLFKHVNGIEQNIIIFILGVLSSNMTQILSYYFGSSKGADDKMKVIDTLSQK